MERRRHKNLHAGTIGWAVFLAIIVTGCGVSTDLPSMKQGEKHKGRPAAEAIRLPDSLTDEAVNRFVARLDDEQARRVLVEELRKQTAGPEKSVREQYSGFAGAVRKTHEIASHLEARWRELASGVRSAPEFLPRAYAEIRGSGDTPLTVAFRLGVGLAVFLGTGAGCEWFYRRLTRNVRRRLGTPGSTSLTIKLKSLALLAAIELGAIAVFVLSTLIVFLPFDTPFRRLLLLAYVGTLLAVRAVELLSRFLLAPRASALRLTPLSDAAASIFHRWIAWIALAAGAGLLISVFMELERTEEGLVVLTRGVTGLVVVLLVIAAMIRNRESISGFIRSRAPESSAAAVALRTQLADIWIYFAIPYVAVAWILWVLILLLERAADVAPPIALWAVPLIYLVLNAAVQKMLDLLSGGANIVSGVRTPAAPVEGDHPGGGSPAGPDRVEGAGPQEAPPGYVKTFRRCLSVFLAGAVILWVLHLRGVTFAFGERIVEAAFQIVVAAVVCFAAWKAVEGAIARRLATVHAAGWGEDHLETYGKGGSRVQTVLILARKALLVTLLAVFVLIALSALGVDIKPLLAGAGIVGLAVGFGSQTLVKDVVAGIFYLIDDAFRVGDYVESGSLKGTVEHISIRSLRLRHPRGMVHTVPFGHLGSITNFSRDYIVEKIAFGVPYDADLKKIKRVVKQISKDIEEDEELGPKLLEPVKSQGVREFGDSGIIMRVKFRTRPFDQFVIRREFFTRLHKAFEKAGLQFATRQVVVHLPGESAPVPLSSYEAGGSAGDTLRTGAGRDLLSAGAAAAIAQILTEEEKSKRTPSDELEAVPSPDHSDD